ncbi:MULTISPECIES: carbon-nitrogen hydrolase family protein [unclassified Actinomadura]|uniref:carbon-nitrogen hydrolase family protein n=1 Tax=unclassified Actinomadura TaxID=2626254 RepID=UPI0011EF3882|nr:carbon-nitrogen hydrolase family protein [Actinomadura sp. K4S16]
MKDHVDVAIVQFEPRPLDLAGNLEAMAEAVRAEAAGNPADLVVFPELATTGYLPPAYSDDFRRRLASASDTIPGRTTETLGRVARETGTHIVVGLAERGEDEELFNTLLLIGPDGETIGAHRKVHLWDQEPGYFGTGRRFGVLDTGLGRIGLSVCHDSRFPEATRQQVVAGAEILICVFAYAPDPGVPADILTHRTVTRAWENAAYYVLANRLGSEYGADFAGRSVIAGPTGQILSAAHGERDPVVRARLHRRPLADARRVVDVARERRPDVYGDLTPIAPETTTTSRQERP